jgi:hypothetical protein
VGGGTTLPMDKPISGDSNNFPWSMPVIATNQSRSHTSSHLFRELSYSGPLFFSPNEVG